MKLARNSINWSTSGPILPSTKWKFSVRTKIRTAWTPKKMFWSCCSDKVLSRITGISRVSATNYSLTTNQRTFWHPNGPMVKNYLPGPLRPEKEESRQRRKLINNGSEQFSFELGRVITIYKNVCLIYSCLSFHPEHGFLWKISKVEINLSPKSTQFLENNQ